MGNCCTKSALEPEREREPFRMAIVKLAKSLSKTSLAASSHHEMPSSFASPRLEFTALETSNCTDLERFRNFSNDEVKAKYTIDHSIAQVFWM